MIDISPALHAALRQLRAAFFLFSVSQLAYASSAVLDNPSFPTKALSFIDAEYGPIEKAVKGHDLEYFRIGTSRVKSFLNAWPKGRNGETVTALYPACAHAVMDIFIDGLCRTEPAGMLCGPGEFRTLVENEIAACQQLRKSILEDSDSDKRIYLILSG